MIDPTKPLCGNQMNRPALMEKLKFQKKISIIIYILPLNSMDIHKLLMHLIYTVVY